MNREITLDGCGWEGLRPKPGLARELRWRKRILQKLSRERSNSIILKQNAQLRKDGYTGPFLGACLLAPPPKN